MESPRDIKGYCDAEHEAEVDAGPDLALYDVKRYQRALADYEDRLELVRAKPRAELLNADQWYVRRRNDGVPDSYLPVVEPSFAMIDDLRQRDLWGRNIAAERRAGRERQEALRRAEQREREAMTYERMDSLDRLSVSF